MPKFLRVSSPKPTSCQLMKSSWNSYLNDGVLLKEFSKIGLSSIQIPFKQQVLITNLNNRFGLKYLGGDNFTDIAQDTGSYDVVSLLHLMNNQIADHFGFLVTDGATASIGRQTIFYLSPLNTVIGFFRRNTEEVFAPVVNQNMTIGATYRYTVHANPVDGDSFAINGQFALKGCHYFRTTLVPGSVIGRLRLGLFTNINNPVLASDMNFYFGITDDGAEYTYYNADTQQEIISAIVPVINDIMSIEISNRFVRYVIYRGLANHILFTHAIIKYDMNTHFKCIVVLYPNTTLGFETEIGVPVCINNPSYAVNLDNKLVAVDSYEKDNDTEYKQENIGIPTPTGNTRFHFYFSDTLGESLGYETFVWNGQTAAIDMIATKKFVNNIMSKSIIIEVPSLDLQSFDMDIHQRRSILAIGNGGNSTASGLSFYTPSPIMLVMNNIKPLLLRNIIINIFVDSGDGELLIDYIDQIELGIVLD